jgi:putative endonuclease
MPDFRGVGREAEDRVADFLVAKGYTIVTRRFKAKHGEIDLVALDGDLLVFVEVKWRRDADARPEDAVDERKAMHLAAAAAEYLREVGEPNRPFRCDIVAATPLGMRHYEDALRSRSERRANKGSDEAD